VRLYFALAFIFLSFSSFAQQLNLSRDFIHLGHASNGNASIGDTLILSFPNSLSGPLVLEAPAGLELSLNGGAYQTNLSIPSAAGINYQIKLRLKANQIDDAIFQNFVQIKENGQLRSERILTFGSSIDTSRSLSVCTWNIKYFGDPQACNCDTALSLDYAIEIMKSLDVDVFALQEIVSETQLTSLTQALGSNYDYLLSDYGSFVNDSNDPDWVDVQKLAYVYRSDKLENLGTYGLLKSTYPSNSSASSPYGCFASGRFPFALWVKMKHTANQDSVLLINIHAKAFSGTSEHNRRACGAKQMTDSLQAQYPNENIIVLGDFNDKLEGAITSGFSISPYDYMFQNNFVGLTKVSDFPGEQTWLGSGGSIIDNIVVSNDMYPHLIPNSVLIFDEVTDIIEDFRYDASDHIPVLSFFYPDAIVTKTADFESRKSLFQAIPGFGSKLLLRAPKDLSNPYRISIVDLQGAKLKDFESMKSSLSIDLDELPIGVYIVSIVYESRRELITWLKN